MTNVYGQVDEFYAGDKDAEGILPKDMVERYLRRKAWEGASDEELREKWGILSTALRYLIDLKLYDLSFLTPYDYQEIVYRVLEDRSSKPLDESHVMGIMDFFDQFNEYLRHMNFSYLQDTLQEARASFYEDGEFAMPERRSADDFYVALEHREELTAEDMDRLNGILDTLLRNVGEYFHRSEFVMDLTRAVTLFGGPNYEHSEEPDVQEAFWFSFWDFFLFDYHLLQTDETPLRYFYLHEKKNLKTTEVDIIKDLLRARFTVFYIEDMGEDYLACRDMFTEEAIDLPAPDSFIPDYRRVVLYGHIHARGVMLLNYVTTVPASDRLRKRMKDEILRQYELFKYQAPEATQEMFFARQSAAVRHTIQILSDFAQLKVVPLKNYPAPIPSEEGLKERFASAEERLKDAALQLGFSIYGIGLILKFYEDFLIGSSLSDTLKRRAATLTAILFLFAQINGLDIMGVKGGIEIFGARREDVFQMVPEVQKSIKCIPFDPRYLTEEGFVQALYQE